MASNVRNRCHQYCGYCTRNLEIVTKKSSGKIFLLIILFILSFYEKYFIAKLLNNLMEIINENDQKIKYMTLKGEEIKQKSII